MCVWLYCIEEKNECIVSYDFLNKDWPNWWLLYSSIYTWKLETACVAFGHVEGECFFDWPRNVIIIEFWARLMQSKFLGWNNISSGLSSWNTFNRNLGRLYPGASQDTSRKGSTCWFGFLRKTYFTPARLHWQFGRLGNRPCQSVVRYIW